MEQAIGTSAACRVLGKSRATLHRQRNPKPAAPPAGRKEFRHPAELSPEEKQSVLAVLDSPRFADKAVAQAYTILLDEGCYLCSQATMHRLLRERGTSGERRAQAAHPAKKKPELLAAGPDEVWSWDITKLKGPARGIAGVPRVPRVCVLVTWGVGARALCGGGGGGGGGGLGGGWRWGWGVAGGCVWWCVARGAGVPRWRGSGGGWGARGALAGGAGVGWAGVAGRCGLARRARAVRGASGPARSLRVPAGRPRAGGGVGDPRAAPAPGSPGAPARHLGRGWSPAPLPMRRWRGAWARALLRRALRCRSHTSPSRAATRPQSPPCAYPACPPHGQAASRPAPEGRPRQPPGLPRRPQASRSPAAADAVTARSPADRLRRHQPTSAHAPPDCPPVASTAIEAHHHSASTFSKTPSHPAPANLHHPLHHRPSKPTCTSPTRTTAPRQPSTPPSLQSIPPPWYLLYVILDIYSRKVIHWEIWPTETGTLAKEFIEHAIAVNGGIKPRAVHADRGTSMTSDTVAGLYAKLNIAQSHSRPRVSDDNPYSEAQLPGSGQGSHLPAPTDPDVSLSAHPARAVQSFGQYRSAQCANSRGASFRTSFSHSRALLSLRSSRLYFRRAQRIR